MIHTDVLFTFSSSYLHCEWKTAEELERGDKRIHQKIKRYYMKKTQNQQMFSEVLAILNEILRSAV